MAGKHRRHVLVAADAEPDQPLQPRLGRALADVVADGQRARRRNDREQAVLLQVEPAVLELEAAEQGEGVADLVEVGAEQLGEMRLGVAGLVGVFEEFVADRVVAVDGPHVEDDVDVEQILRPRAAHPFGDARLPQIERAAELGILRHDAALAVGHAGGVEEVGEAPAELGKPAVLGAAGLARGEDDGVVLVGGEQALAAAARAEHEQAPWAGRGAQTLCRHRVFREDGGAARHGAQLLADDLRDDAGVEALGDQSVGDGGQRRPGGRHLRRRAGGFEPVVEVDGDAGAQLEHVACRDDAGQPPVLVAHGEVADLQAVHAADGAVGESLGADRGERTRGDLADPASERRFGARRDQAHDVALGDDAVVADRRAGLAGVGDEDRRDAPCHHQRDDLAGSGVGTNDDRRGAHQVADAVAVGVGVDGLEDRCGGCGDRRHPAGLVGLVEFAGEPERGALGLGQGADAALLELRQERQEDLGRGLSIAQRRMAAADGNAEPGGQSVERIVGEARIGYLGQQPNAERARPLPGQVGAAGLFFQHSEIEADRMADEGAAGGEFLQLIPCGGELGRTAHHGVGDVVDARGGRRNGDAGVDEEIERRPVMDPAARQGESADLDDARLGRVEAGGLGVERHRVQRYQRRRAARHLHGTSPNPDRGISRMASAGWQDRVAL